MPASQPLWVEKYRPHSFDDIMDQDVAVKKLRDFIDNNVVPHLIFSGPPGIGKTSAAHVFVKSLFPPEMLSECVLELNASEERGIRTVRGKIKRFVSGAIQLNNLPVRSIVILDEADSLTLDSQYALRRVMEDSSKTSRFILICNYINRIIPPLISRCTIIHFHSLRESTTKEILNNICKKEHLRAEEYLDNIPSSDVRQAIHMIQKAASGLMMKTQQSIDWKEILAKKPSEIMTDVENLLLDGYDVDFLLEDFVTSSDHFLDGTLNICSNIANHGNPIIQLTSLLLLYKSS